jgi:hypothetical protein
MIYYDHPPLYSLKSFDFFILEKKVYHLRKRIDDLDMMISSLLEKLNLMEFPDKNNIIEQVQNKKDLVKSYQIRYKKINDDYVNNFRYYRNVFNFYKNKYYGGKYEKKKILGICVTIQELIRDNLFSFYNQYSLLKKLYEEANEFILKIKDKFK